MKNKNTRKRRNKSRPRSKSSYKTKGTRKRTRIPRRRTKITKRRTKKLELPRFYSSSILAYYFNHCIKALAEHLRGKFRERDIFLPGVAAHAIIQRIGYLGLNDVETIKARASEVAAILQKEGREFYGMPEPPLPPEAIKQGWEIAIGYLKDNPLPQPARYETVFSIDRDGKPCRFDEARLTSKTDCTYFSVDEQDIPGDIVVVQDWKSYWNAGEDDLDTLQRRIQMMMGYKHHGTRCAGVKAVVVNLRTGKKFSRTVRFDKEGIELLERWCKEALQTCDIVDKLLSARTVKGIPGAGCYGCPFIKNCRQCHIAAKSDEKEELATAYAAEFSRASDMRRKLILMLDEFGSIPVNGGKVGFDRATRNIRKAGAEEYILAKLYGKTIEQVQTEHGNELGLLKMLDLGAKNIYNFAKRRIAEVKERSDFFNATLENQGVASFRVWPDNKLNLDQILNEEKR